jgi:hypothetical protein
MVKAFEIALLLTIVIAGFGPAVLQLWNWLMPTIFGLQRISFWQAVGLLGLCWILFGRGFLGQPGYGTHWRHRMSERWEQMTPEQRATFRKGLHSRCGEFKPPPADRNV